MTARSMIPTDLATASTAALRIVCSRLTEAVMRVARPAGDEEADAAHVLLDLALHVRGEIKRRESGEGV